MEYRRYDMETDDELIYRICSMKGNENLLTWNDIADVLNNLLGTTYTESKFRKFYQNAQKIINKKQEELADLSNQLDELEELKESIRKERMKLQTVNIERNRIDRQDARKELFYEQIGQYIKKVNPPKLDRVYTKKQDKKYILTLSDVHMGADFVSVNNEYSPKIVKDRFEILKEEVINFIKDKGLQQLTIVGLGDTIQGILRLNDLRINDSTVVKSAVDIAQLISTFLNDLSSYCDIDYYDSIYGNHQQTRYLGSSANAMMNEDLGYIIGHYIQDVMNYNDRVQVYLPNEGDTFMEVDGIFDFNILIGHGHQLKTIEDGLKDLSIQRRKLYDYLIIGHMHNDRNICCGESYNYDTEILIAPSICGSDGYSDSLYKGTKSACAIYGFDKLYGHTETYKIILN